MLQSRMTFNVQSFKYKNYLPLGNPEIIVKNLNDWSADEILIQCIDRSVKNSGPHFELLEKITNQSITTPIVLVVELETLRMLN